VVINGIDLGSRFIFQIATFKEVHIVARYLAIGAEGFLNLAWVNMEVDLEKDED
jgi:hypothetical protein